VVEGFLEGALKFWPVVLIGFGAYKIREHLKTEKPWRRLRNEKRRLTIVWSLILIGAGSLFLLGNFFPELRPWRLIAHYWSAPGSLCAILASHHHHLGISKLASYLRSHQDPAAGRRSMLSGGDGTARFPIDRGHHGNQSHKSLP
jgi:peptidoglycan/LPS O-acetylase OafA/YrhL